MKTLQTIYGITRDYLIDHASQLSPDLYKSLTGMVRARDLKGLAGCASRFEQQLHSSIDFRHLRQVEAFFKKNVLFSDPIVCEAAARQGFSKAETVCKITNKRLDHYYTKRDRLDPDLSQKLDRMEAYVSRILGDRQIFLAGLTRRIKVTPGATATRSRRESLPYLKLDKRIDVSPGAAKYVRALSESFGYGFVRTSTTPVNRVELVPKNWKTHRTIACEPTGNVPFQLAFDSYVKENLRRKSKINLSDQSRNQELARIGSITGEFATIDLAAASDTLAFNTVAWLLPRDWFEFANDLRSPFYRLDGTLNKYHKFSSMGNGMTFVLETLVFAAACNAVGSKVMCVYGDDIVIESHLADELIELLAFLGFSTNAEKSFLSGPFRESCGKDYWLGTDVTPFYIRKWPISKTPGSKNHARSMMCHNVNGLARVSLPEGKLWKRLKGLITDNSLPWVPFSESTIFGIHVDISTAYSSKKIRFSRWETKAKGFISKTPKLIVPDSRSLFLWHLDAYRAGDREYTLEDHQDYFVQDEAPSADYNVRSRVPTGYVKYVRKWVRWHPPTKAIPDHLFWWSDYMTRSQEPAL